MNFVVSGRRLVAKSRLVIKQRLFVEMAGLLLVALALHFWQLAHIPPGLDDDSAANGWIGIQWLRGGPVPFWSMHTGAAEPLMAWLQSVTTWLLGPSVYALRTVSALALALAAPVTYLLTWEVGRAFVLHRSVSGSRQHFTPDTSYIPRWGARFAGLLVAAGPVFLEVGRTGLRATLLPLAVGLLLLALLYALRTGRPRYYLLGGLLLGLALYTYLAARFLPLAVGLFLLLRFGQDIVHAPARRRFLLGGGLLFGSALLIALPQLIFFLGAPAAFWVRAGAVTLAQNPLAEELSYGALLLHKLAGLARMLGLEWSGQYNQAQRPLLQPLAFVGLLASGWFVIRRWRAPGLQLMVITAGIMLLPDLVGGDRLEPHTLRLIGSLLPLVVLSGLGLAWLSLALVIRIKATQTDARLATGVGILLAGWLLAWGAIDWVMVIEPRLSRSQFSWYAREDVALAQWINRQDEAVLVPVYELSRPTIAYLTAARAGPPSGGLPDPAAHPTTAWLVEPADPTRTRVEAASYRYDPTALVLLGEKRTSPNRAWLLPPLDVAALDRARAACPEWIAIREENPRTDTPQTGGRACRVDFSALDWHAPPPPISRAPDSSTQNPTTPVQADTGYLFHNDLHLLEATADTREIDTQTTLGVNLYWQAHRTGNRADNRPWRLYVHLLDDAQTRIAGEDFMPAYGFFGTEMWGTEMGETEMPGTEKQDTASSRHVIPLRQLLALPADLPPGRYWLAVGLYDPLTLERSAVRQYGTETPVEQARFGPLKVTLPPITPLPDGNRLPAIRLGDTLALTAYTVDPAPDRVTVQLQLEALAPPPLDYTFFLHVVGPDGEVIAQHDAQPHDGAYPTGIWDGGETVLTELTADLPPDTIESQTAAASTEVGYTLWVGAYDWQSGQRLPIVTDDAADGIEGNIEVDMDRVRLPLGSNP